MKNVRNKYYKPNYIHKDGITRTEEVQGTWFLFH